MPDANRRAGTEEEAADLLREMLSSIVPFAADAELETLTSDECAATIRAAFVTHPDDLPIALVDRARRKADARIAATEGRHSRR